MFNVGDRVRISSDFFPDFFDPVIYKGIIGTVISINNSNTFPVRVYFDNGASESFLAQELVGIEDS